jgi:hypothetical protein
MLINEIQRDLASGVEGYMPEFRSQNQQISRAIGLGG